MQNAGWLRRIPAFCESRLQKEMASYQEIFTTGLKTRLKKLGDLFVIV